MATQPEGALPRSFSHVTVTLSIVPFDKVSVSVQLALNGRHARISKRQRHAVNAAVRAQGPTVCFDLSYGSIMNSTEVNALANQLALVYGYNRKLPQPLLLTMAGISAASVEACIITSKDSKHMDTVAQALHTWSWEKWLVQREAAGPAEAFKGRRMVYLTSDSDRVLDTISDDTIYIVGGLVDHKVKPRAALELAQNSGICTARLPLDEFMSLQKPALTCIAVFQILERFVRSRDWEEAICGAPALRCAPLRKYVKWSKRAQDREKAREHCKAQSLPQRDQANPLEKRQR